MKLQSLALCQSESRNCGVCVVYVLNGEANCFLCYPDVGMYSVC